MPLHCDTLDGSVVKMAKRALETGNVHLILPFVPKESEGEVIAAFNKVLPLHKQPNGAHEIADMFFFETVVRLHRAGEGVPYTGLKPAEMDEGPVAPIAELAVETGSVEELKHALIHIIEDEVEKRFEHTQQLKQHLEVSEDDAEAEVDDAREYVESMLELQVWSHNIYLAATSGAHEMTGERQN